MLKNYKNRSLLLGVGFDAKDGHVRITKGDNFRLFGGSEETHSTMQEKAIKFNEELTRKKKTLDEMNHDELAEIADKIGMKKLRKPQN